MNLQWTASKLEAASKYRSESRTGCRCLFIPTSNHTGIKLYPFEKMRDVSWRLQYDAYKKGFAPRAGEKFVIDDPSIFNDLVIQRPMDWKVVYPRLFGFVTQRAMYVNRYDGDAVSRLHNAMKLAGLPVGDLFHDPNTGILNGKLVCIDFDPYSMGTYREGEYDWFSKNG